MQFGISCFPKMDRERAAGTLRVKPPIVPFLSLRRVLVSPRRGQPCVFKSVFDLKSWFANSLQSKSGAKAKQHKSPLKFGVFSARNYPISTLTHSKRVCDKEPDLGQNEGPAVIRFLFRENWNPVMSLSLWGPEHMQPHNPRAPPKSIERGASASKCHTKQRKITSRIVLQRSRNLPCTLMIRMTICLCWGGSRSHRYVKQSCQASNDFWCL